MKTILITGGTGLIGNHLAPMLKEKGYRIHLLSRSNKQVFPYDAVFTWNYKKGTIDKDAFKGVTHIIHLAGAGIADQNWTPTRKKEILESRVNTATLLMDCLKEQSIHLEAFIGGSAIGWYGAQTESLLHTEIEPSASDYMGETCRVWERASDLFERNSKRVVKIRTGVVLAKDSGALPKMILPFKYHLGAVLGTGNQQIPWIHVKDICRIFTEAIENENYVGSINAVATQDCTNKVFMRTLATVLKKSLFPLHVPSIVIKLIFGEMSVVVLEGNRISNAKLMNLGYRFSFYDLDKALKDLLKNEL
jgi:uncharacterized protein (TIGR01777 family)